MNGEIKRLKDVEASSQDALLLRSRMCEAEFQQLLQKHGCTVEIAITDTYTLGRETQKGITLKFVPLVEPCSTKQ